jgi:hypothetical protein
MRLVLVAAALALLLAPSAAASFGPPLTSVPSTLRTIPVVSLRAAEERRASSCIAHARKSSGPVGRVERRLAPVACEQPPRSKVMGVGFFFRLAP